ncbi:pseudouridine synthase [Paenibacillus sp. J31TS4]|uniref:pseudouridine synthase n=1 Tax=Paenibacillus sp. J31TS4 TaxID=2807195 RepID=UPI001B119500|nr:pseudouridine synthase [Paenibacillus sp. J31TS4]GIP37975.1 pseudouridine synthase [Paenibacillus sp. J31TS4]
MKRKTQRLDKLLAHAGVGTRSEIKQLVRAGAVTVDGVRVKDSGRQTDPEHETIQVDGETVRYREFLYVMMNKPPGVVSATEDNRDRTVLDLLDAGIRHYELFPVGRLDKDTEGLLLLTNDGKLAHNLLSPRKHVPKTYYAEVEGLVGEEDRMRFADGVELDDGYRTLPAQLVVLEAEESREGARSRIELTIHEGKFHQVKRMFQAVGKRVIYLKRLTMGTLRLDPELKLGTYRELSEEELHGLKGGESQ